MSVYFKIVQIVVSARLTQWNYQFHGRELTVPLGGTDSSTLRYYSRTYW